MKRSELLDKIHLLLEKQSLQGTAYRFKAHEILELLEKEDVITLPPIWESEDETK